MDGGLHSKRRGHEPAREGEPMTDRLRGFVVTLEHDIREDDAAVVVSAIEQIRGVLSVKAVVADLAHHMATERARHELWDKLAEVLK